MKLWKVLTAIGAVVVGADLVGVVVGGAENEQGRGDQSESLQTADMKLKSPSDSNTKMVLYSGQKACWIPVPNDPNRPEVTCRNFNEAFLRSLMGMSKKQVVTMMGVPGQEGAPYHFMSNDSEVGHYNGFVTLSYDNNNQVSVIYAIVTKITSNGLGDDIKYTYNKDGFLCSDFPKSYKKCGQ